MTMRRLPMKIEQRKTSGLIPYEQNPRMNDAAVAAVAKSIEAFGFRVPIIVDSDGVIVCGHTRRLAAISLGLLKVPVHVATDLTPEQVRAYRIADNQTASIAEWDVEALSAELAELAKIDFDLDSLGFDDGELDAMLAGLAGADNGEWADAMDKVPEGDGSGFRQMTFTLTDAQAETVFDATKRAKAAGFTDTGNENSNGNALAAIAGAYCGS